MSIDYSESIAESIARLDKANFIGRLWKRDSSLWKTEAEHQKIISNSLGWLGIIDTMLDHLNEMKEFAEEIRDEGFAHVLLLGMGGSSLCPEVLRRTFGHRNGYPELLVLDSTVPDAVRRVERQIDPARTLFIISSKSGLKIEPQVFLEYFHDKASQLMRRDPGRNFIAITDAGSPLEAAARSRNFRRIFLNPSDIGGRYSALSYFGIIPAVVAGYDVEELLNRANHARRISDPNISVAKNPAARLGASLGALACNGRDKLTLFISPPIDSFGLWIEQLVAESTGKEGRGILPVAGEPVGEPDVYGEDRVFVHINLCNSEDHLESKVRALESAGHPVVRRKLDDELNLAGEFFDWELAISAAGFVIGINPFDQPNVQESLENTAKLLEEYEREGSFHEQRPAVDEDGIRIYQSAAFGETADADSSSRRAGAANESQTGGGLGLALTRYLDTIQAGDYFAITAFIEETQRHDALLHEIRAYIRDTKHIATTIGYGPRFLHSTGQLHKGGAANGFFFQITADDSEDIAIPNRPYTFGIIKQAQALGDFKSLSHRGFRVVRIHLGVDIVAGLSRLCDLIKTSV